VIRLNASSAVARQISTSKSSTDFADQLIRQVKTKLANVDYIIHETPFGYLNEWKMHVAGESLAATGC